MVTVMLCLLFWDISWHWVFLCYVSCALSTCVVIGDECMLFCVVMHTLFFLLCWQSQQCIAAFNISQICIVLVMSWYFLLLVFAKVNILCWVQSNMAVSTLWLCKCLHIWRKPIALFVCAVKNCISLRIDVLKLFIQHCFGRIMAGSVVETACRLQSCYVSAFLCKFMHIKRFVLHFKYVRIFLKNFWLCYCIYTCCWTHKVQNTIWAPWRRDWQVELEMLLHLCPCVVVY